MAVSKHKALFNDLNEQINFGSVIFHFISLLMHLLSIYFVLVVVITIQSNINAFFLDLLANLTTVLNDEIENLGGNPVKQGDGEYSQVKFANQSRFEPKIRRKTEENPSESEGIKKVCSKLISWLFSKAETLLLELGKENRVASTMNRTM